MFEALLMGAGGGKLTYSDSGPGPQMLAFGDLELGFFGEVASTDILSGSDLKAQISALAGKTVENDTTVWLKFTYKGKYLFIPKKPLFSNINWNQLYNGGLMYGTDDNGRYNTGFNVNQIQLATKGAYRFKVKTIQSDVNDPTTLVNTSGSATNDNVAYHLSEYTDLIYRVCNRLVTNYPTDKWAQYTETDLGINVGWDIAQESVSANINYHIARGGGVVFRTTGVVKTSAFYWRPVLELVKPNDLFSLRINSLSVTGGLLSVAGPVTAIPDVPTDPNALQRLTSFGIDSEILKGVTTPAPVVVAAVSGLQTIKPTTNPVKYAASVVAVFNN